MNFDTSIVWARIGQMLNSVIAALPSILIAFIVFTLFYIGAKGISSLVVHFTRRRQRHRNLGLALGRLSQWTVVFIGGLVALSIVLPTFKAGDLIQLLGIGDVAIGLALVPFNSNESIELI